MTRTSKSSLFPETTVAGFLILLLGFSAMDSGAGVGSSVADALKGFAQNVKNDLFTEPVVEPIKDFVKRGIFGQIDDLKSKTTVELSRQIAEQREWTSKELANYDALVKNLHASEGRRGAESLARYNELSARLESGSRETKAHLARSDARIANLENSLKTLDALRSALAGADLEGLKWNLDRLEAYASRLDELERAVAQISLKVSTIETDLEQIDLRNSAAIEELRRLLRDAQSRIAKLEGRSPPAPPSANKFGDRKESGDGAKFTVTICDDCENDCDDCVECRCKVGDRECLDDCRKDCNECRKCIADEC